MSTPTSAPIPIHPSQLVIGLYVWLDLGWMDHPFLTSRIMVSSQKDIDMICATKADGRLYYYPDLSEIEPLARCETPVKLPVKTAAEVTAADLAKAALLQEMQTLEHAKKEKLRIQRAAHARADRNWEIAARATREALLNLSRAPKSAGAQLYALSQQTAASIAAGQEILLHLLGNKKGQGPQFHALNVMSLAMLVGKVAGLSERELCDLALGALMHDCGKTQIPHVILESSARRKFEEDMYREHVQFSVLFATESGAFTPEALAVIADHHECLDGSGWPNGKTNFSRAARILSLVNRYDRLCSPEAVGREALAPSEALAYLFQNQVSKYGIDLLSILIKLLGVYPPGTVVQLSDGTLALVVAPGATSLQPRVLIYSPETTRDEAPTLDLADEPGLKVAEAIRLSTLPPPVLEWMKPQQRLSYFWAER